MSCAALAAIGLHLASMHSRPGFENINPGIYAINRCGWMAGAYRNSFDQPSLYVARLIDPPRAVWFVSAGLITGYDRPLTPVIAVGAKARLTPNLTLRLTFVPEVGNLNNAAVAHLSLERRF